MNPIGKKLLSAAILAACVSGLSAQPGTAFENGDLILGFQVTSGDGNEKNIFFNLGSAIDYRDGTNQTSLGNIDATLSEVYGNGDGNVRWFDRADLRFGVIGNRSHLVPGFGAPAPVNGDPTATLYVSQPAAAAGQGAVSGVGSSTELGNAGGRVTGLENALSALGLESDGAAILDQNEHLPAQWQNGWSVNNPASPSPSFGVFSNIEQHFGQGGDAVHVDIQRILATTTGANPSGPVLQGEYVVTISIDGAGNITASKAGGGEESSFDEWIAQFAAQIPNEADRLPGADADKDGVTNFEEFAFGGHPANPASRGIRLVRTADTDGDSEGELTLTIEVRAGASFAPSGNALAAGKDGVSYTIEGSLNLIAFDSPVSEVTPHLGTGSPSAGYEFKTFRLNASNGLPDKGFLRTRAE